MERQVREAEIVENEERRSQPTSVKSNLVSNRNVYTEGIVHNPNVESCSSKSSLMPAAENKQLRTNPVSRVNSYVTDWVNALEPFVKNDNPYISVQNPRNEDVIKSDVDKLCEALGEVIKNVTKTQTPSTMKPNALFARHSTEKYFPIFDRKSEEWPTFKSHFRKISSTCEYTQEESMIKLQKCLRGEVKQVVAGMMISPENIEQVIQTLEMRFGRPDQIIDTILNKLKTFYSILENDMENLIQFASYVNSLVSMIKSLRYDAHLQNPNVL
ncbi:hypothetical protein JTB14_026022 [Gonioctena quinquepunctata]|nr:hypothetical protein JTB14_026022 [Gonioctena quinquepunctata]